MAVTEQVPINMHTGNGVTTVFGFDFRLLAASDLRVLVGGTPVIAYSVAGVGNPSGGSVAFAAPPPAGQRILLIRASALARLTDYQNNGDLHAKALNLDLDRVWLVLQEILSGAGGIRTTLRVPDDETIPPLVNAKGRAQTLVGFDRNGNPMVQPAVDVLRSIGKLIYDYGAWTPGGTLHDFGAWG